MAFVQPEDNTKYEDLLKQAGTCDSIGFEIRVVTLIQECSVLSKKEIEDKLSTLQGNYDTEKQKLDKDKEDYEIFKEKQKEELSKELNSTVE